MVRKIRNAKLVFLLLAVMLSGAEASFSQTQNIPVLKTMQDSIFNVGDEIKMPHLLFDLNGGWLLEPSKDSLKQVGAFLIKHPKLVVEISTHTDYRSPAEYNEQLSSRRAKFCADYIVIELGIASQRIFSKGYGENRPAYLYSDLILPSGQIVKVGTQLTEKWINTNYPIAKNKDDFEALMYQNRRTSMKIIRTDYGQ